MCVVMGMTFEQLPDNSKFICTRMLKSVKIYSITYIKRGPDLWIEDEAGELKLSGFRTSGIFLDVTVLKSYDLPTTNSISTSSLNLSQRSPGIGSLSSDELSINRGTDNNLSSILG